MNLKNIIGVLRIIGAISLLAYVAFVVSNKSELKSLFLFIALGSFASILLIYLVRNYFMKYFDDSE